MPVLHVSLKHFLVHFIISPKHLQRKALILFADGVKIMKKAFLKHSKWLKILPLGITFLRFLSHPLKVISY